LGQWCQDYEPLITYLVETRSDAIVRDLAHSIPPQGINQEIWSEWQERFHDYLDLYGYSIYDMDFFKPLPMDDPAPIIELLRLFITGKSKNPYERQQVYVERREAAENGARSRIRGLRRWGFEKSLNWAQSQAPLREDGIAEIGLGYPVLRKMLSELGNRFVEANTIQDSGDIYWLEENEIKEMAASLENGQPLIDRQDLIRERKATWRARKSATPPPQLPVGKKRYMGFDMEAVLAGGEGGIEGNIIKGVPSSPGQSTAPARVLNGPEDFDQMQPGEILIAGITTPAWTPLFALASGVVTDIGGPLSHGSIVAREYGIPAVLGTGIATSSITSGDLITVDGNAGTVTLLNNN
jgi:pyruvate,water dikinase